MLSLVEIGPLVLEKTILKFHQCIFTNHLLLERGGALNLNKFEFPSAKNDFSKVWLQLAQWFWRKWFFNFVNIFSLFRNYLPLEKGGSLYLNKFESPSPTDIAEILPILCKTLSNQSINHPKMICAKLSGNWSSGSGEDFQNL